MDTTIHLGNKRQFTPTGVGPNNEPEPLDITTPLEFSNVTGCTVIEDPAAPGSLLITPDQTVGGAFSVQVKADADTAAGSDVPVFGVINGVVIPNQAVSLGFGEGAETPI